MNKRAHYRRKKTFESILSLILCFAILWPNTLVFAEYKNSKSEITNDFVTVTIEDYATGELILEPKKVEIEPDMNGTIQSIKAIQLAFEGGSINTGLGPMWEIIVKSITTPDGKIIENSDSYNWVAFANSSKVEDLDFARLNANGVVRLVYINKNGEDIGIEGNKLTVNKDALITKLSTVNSEDKQNEKVNEIYQKGLKLIMDKNVNSDDIEKVLKELDDTLNPIIPAEGVTISPDEAILNIGQTINLKAVLEPANSTDNITWKTENTYIADVDENGIVTGKNAGEVNIIAEAGNVKAKTKITVKEVNIENIYFEKENIKISQGEKTKLNLIVEPKDTTDKITWTTLDNEIVEVDEFGYIIGKKPGNATIVAISGSLIAKCEVEVGERIDYIEPTVVFQYESGEIKEADENGVFTLSALDVGKFILEGAKDIEFFDGKPYWDSSEKVTEGLVTKTNVWVSADGKFYPHEPKTVSAKVLDRSPAIGGEKIIKEFKIKCIETNIEELKGFVDGEEISTTVPYSLDGSESKKIDIKGRLKGMNEYIDIPVQALGYNEVGSGYGYINGGTFGMNTSYDLPKGAIAKFAITMIDKTAQFTFEAISEKVDAIDFNIGVPNIAYIDKWNVLGNQFIGLIPSIDFMPENATNKKTIWEALTPEIAEYRAEHNNGIVPKKAGVAKFRVTAVDNPALVKDVIVEFKYKTPLTNTIIEKENIVIEQFTEMELPIKATPENATEQRFNWSFDKEGIVEISENIYFDSVHNVNGKTVTSHKLVAKKVGTVTVVGTPIDNTADCEPIKFKVTVKPAETEESTQYLKLATENIEHGKKYLMEEPYSSYGYEWNLFTLLRTGANITEGDINSYKKSAVEMIKQDQRLNPTDYSRIAFTLGAAGYNITNIEGINLAEILYSNEKLNKYPSNQIIWTLIALDSKEYNIPKDAIWTREKIIEEILLSQTKDGSFSLGKNQTTGSIDITGMALQALAPYYKESAKPELLNQISEETKAKIEKAVDDAITFLKGKITVNGGFVEGGAENSCTVAQVVTGLTALKIDPTTAEGFTFGNKNMITNLASFKRDKGFAYLANQKTDDQMSTIQVTYALNAYERFAKGEKSLYDLTEANGENIKPGEDTENEPNNPDNNIGKPDDNMGKPDNGANNPDNNPSDPKDDINNSDDNISTLPQTGYESNMALFAIMMILAGTTSIYFGKRKFKIR